MNPEDYIGLSERQARILADENDKIIRVFDKENQSVTCDYRPNRINIIVKNGVVVTSFPN